MLLQMFIIPMHFAKNEGLMYVAFFEAFNLNVPLVLQHHNLQQDQQDS